MENAALLILLESVLGKGQKTSRGNYSFKCPFCSHHKNKLEINSITNDKKENPWHCWVCEAKGKTVKALFKHIKAPANKIAELNMIIVPNNNDYYVINNVLELPKEFTSLIDITSLDRLTQIEAKHALKFLRKRGLNINDTIK
jgi:hypothetical protein